jgi:amidohydrolase
VSFDVAQEVALHQRKLISLRRDFHMHPETAFQEKRTSRVIASHLRRLGLRVQTGVGGTGLVGLLQGDSPGPTLMLRADIDALPIEEPDSKPYASRNPGAMHACGHDGHVAVTLVAASILARHRDKLKGSIKLVFQPAEEIMSGALRMLNDGVMRDPVPNRVLGFHLANWIPVGLIGIRPGVIFAGVDELQIVIRGQGGHGALPHKAVDPITAAAQCITAIQTVVSREIAPSSPAVVTFGTIKGGTAFNIIPPYVELTGTVRTFDDKVRRFMLARVKSIFEGVAASMRCEAEYHHVRGCPPVINDPEVTASVQGMAARVVGPEHTRDLEPTTVSDDIALFLEEVPGCYFMVGSANPERGLDGAHHSPAFDFDEAALSIATEVMVRCALEYLS